MVDQPFSRYSMQCTAALWLTPSITLAGLAPTRAREGQTYEKHFGNILKISKPFFFPDLLRYMAF